MPAETRPARSADLPAIVALLKECKLPSDDLTEGVLSTFRVAGAAGQFVGVAGFEPSGKDGLLRSLAVAASHRGSGLGARLVAECEDGARETGLQNLYLLTTTADVFCRRLGYRDVPRETVPAAIAGHPQFRGLCPASAKCLHKVL